MTRYSVAAGVLFATLLMNGCTTSPPGQTDNTYTVGQALPPLSTVVKTAKFGLYAEKSQTPIWSDELTPGDEFGFVKRADGMVYAVAKGKDIPLPDSKITTYFWNRLDRRVNFSDDD